MSGDGGKNDPAGELLEIPGLKRLKPDGSVKFIRKPAGRRDFGPTGGYGFGGFDGSVNLVASSTSAARIAARPDVLLFVDLPLGQRCIARIQCFPTPL